MFKFCLIIASMTFIILQLVEQPYVRPMTVVKDVASVSSKDATINLIQIETQEIINKSSVEIFVENAVVAIMNYRPGQVEDHVYSDEIKSLFISEEHHERFAEQFINWSLYEFNINNISIKESISINGRVLRSPSSAISGGARMWRYRSELPILDRGVGDNQLGRMYITVDMVYLGATGGMGIYAVKIDF